MANSKSAHGTLLARVYRARLGGKKIQKPARRLVFPLVVTNAQTLRNKLGFRLVRIVTEDLQMLTIDCDTKETGA
jgi:hypothetical protein